MGVKDMANDHQGTSLNRGSSVVALKIKKETLLSRKLHGQRCRNCTLTDENIKKNDN